jgi:hypothetical protein
MKERNLTLTHFAETKEAAINTATRIIKKNGSIRYTRIVKQKSGQVVHGDRNSGKFASLNTFGS